MKSQENSRRQFLVRGLVSVAALPFAGAMLSTSASAQALKPLPATNPQAVALKGVKGAADATVRPSILLFLLKKSCLFSVSSF